MRKLKYIFILALLFITGNLKSQNTGPIAPEAMSFEPVDAQGMVNFTSGDLAYVLPLLNVPSPEGGYPLALSYHSGIGVDAEASWVGLGWSLTPGALSRNVSEIPDDMDYGIWTYRVAQDLGDHEYRYLSLTVPIKAVTIGISATWGDYNTVGASVGVAGVGAGVTMGDVNQFSVGVGSVGVYMGDTGYGLSLGIGAGVENGLSGGVGLRIGTDGVGISAGINHAFQGGGFQGSYSLASVGVNFSSSGTSISGRTVGAYSSNAVQTHNRNVSYNTKNNGIDLGLLSFGHSKTEMYLTKEEEKTKIGVLYIDEASKQANSKGWLHDLQHHDYYGVQTKLNISDVMLVSNGYGSDKKVPEEFLLPAYDKYVISGQGVGGSMSPMLFSYYDGNTAAVPGLNLTGNHEILSYHDDNSPNNWYDLIHEEILHFHHGTDFNSVSTATSDIRYFTEYSSIGRLEAAEGEFVYDASHGNASNPYGGLWGNFSYVGGAMTDGTSPKTSQENQDLNYIEWFTNEEIANSPTDVKNRGFIETESIKDHDDNGYGHPRLDARYFDPSGIGAYTITALDGKKYHYSLPVYQFEQVLYKYEEGEIVYESWDLGKYAAHWLLTAITGPDYIDVTGDGLTDDDYGYWVKFEYAKWADSFIWAFPFTVEADYDESQLNGRKQLYYLDAVRTRTHTALFLKDVREDGYGSYANINSSYGLNTVGQTDVYEALELLPYQFNDTEGNTHNKAEIMVWLATYLDGHPIEWTNCNYTPVFTKFSYSKTKVLKLSKIILIKNEDCPDISNLQSSLLNDSQDISRLDYFTFKKVNDQGANETLDQFDYPYTVTNGYFDVINVNILNTYPELITNSIKVIDFNTDYSLCNGAENSTSGKLTLNSLEIKGKGGSDVLPPYNFTYQFNPTYNSDDNMDGWGYYISNSEKYNELDNQDAVVKENTHAWSLTEILTPTGAKMNIEYESDTYWREAATEYGVYAEIESITFPCENAYTFDINFESSGILEEFIIGNYYYFGDMGLVKLKAVSRIDSNTFRFMAYSTAGTIIPFTILLETIETDLEFHSTSTDGCSISAIVDPDIPINYGIIIKDILKENCKILTMELSNNYTYYGGGVRVKSVSLTDDINEYKTTYSYESPVTGITSGITSYAPGNSDIRYIPYKNILPGPSVMYEYCTVTTFDSNGDERTKTRHQYEVLSPAADPLGNDVYFGDLLKINVDDGLRYGPTVLRNARIDDNLSRLGNIVAQTSFNEFGDIIQQTNYEYMDPTEYPYGTRQETYTNAKAFWDWSKDHQNVDNKNFYLTSITKAQYPSVLKQVEIESQYKKETQTFEELDENTGVYLKTNVRNNISNDSYQSLSLPAYYVYDGMGPKVENSSYKNMLTQIAATINKKNEEEYGVSIQTWSNSWNYRDYDESANVYVETTETGVWRKHKQYVWNGYVHPDGRIGNFSDYNTIENLKANWADLYSNPSWQQVNEITRYNRYSLPIESKDVNENYASAKMDLKSEKIIASSANASYKQFTYSGFENQSEGDFVEGEVKLKSTYSVINSSNSHTGEYSLRTYGLSNAFEYVVEGLENGYTIPYKISLWALTQSSQAIQLDVECKFYNSSNSLLYTDSHSLSSYQKQGFGDWYLFDIITPVPNDITGAGQVDKIVINVDNGLSKSYIYIDDFRVHPVNAPMKSYVYDKQTGAVTAIIDNNNIATKYEYDDAGKLKSIYKEVPDNAGVEGGFKKVSEHDYGYSRTY